MIKITDNTIPSKEIKSLPTIIKTDLGKYILLHDD